MSHTYTITLNRLTYAELFDLHYNKRPLELSGEVKTTVNKCREYLDNKMAANDKPIYGINTGFGSLYNVKIEKDNLRQLQENLVMSHACGVGEEVPQEVVRLMLLLKIVSLSKGYSGVQLETLERLVEFYNRNILPVVYTQGSLGASGDLAPLAHLSLPLLGKGEVWYEGQRISGEALLKQMNWQPIQLQSKEGLALLNGTQFMGSYGVYLVLKSFKLQYLADKIGALSLEAYDGRIEPFSHLIHDIRLHKGQQVVAKRVRDFVAGSEIIKQAKVHVQDPYSFRCIPQVHGATYDALHYVAQTILTEANAVTDNPNVFVDEDEIISGGNFHGQPLALNLDYLGIAMAELANISERRIFKLNKAERGLPAFLTPKSGLNSGFMIPQYTAASIVSQNKQLATPASVDSIVSSNGQEDHVSMGANAATKALRIVNNVEKVLAIELLNAAQALEFRRPLKTSEFMETFMADYRKVVPFLEKDVVLSDEILKSIKFLQDYKVEESNLFE
ncbi:MAG: histidine ammonia-lyase [Flavobacteriia bacterium]|nr:MAG: histidine ammonia-lyase [Flavobacteriia bacterium]